MISEPSSVPHATANNGLSRADVESMLQQFGYRVTQPRAIVIDAVISHRRPFTAEQLVAQVAGRPSGANIGRATVYRTLEILAAIDVLTRIIQPDGHPAYVCDSLGHRHHLVCSTCGTAVAFTKCPVDDLVQVLTKDTEFTIHDHLLEVFGVCPRCQTAADTAGAPGLY